MLSSKLSWVFFQGSLSTWCWSLSKLTIGCLPLIFSMLGWKLGVSRSRVVAVSLAVGHDSSQPVGGNIPCQLGPFLLLAACIPLSVDLQVPSTWEAPGCIYLVLG